MLLLAFAGALRSQTPPADLVLTNGTVITVDPKDSVAQAVAIRGSKVVFVGSSAAARAFVGDRTQVVDLAGRTATPGLIDTHVHFSEPADNLDLGDARSMEEVIARVRARVARVKPGEWVRGGGWDEEAGRAALYHRGRLDAAPENPVYLTHTTGHYGVANSLALKLSGVTKETKDPPGGTIDRDKDGNPTGVMKERATSLIRATGGGGGRGNTMRDDVLRIIAGFNREGMTGAKDLNIGQAKWDLYRQLLEEGKLTVRMTALWRGGATIESVQQAIASIKSVPRLPQTLGDGRLVSGGVKLYIDGSGGARTAWMYDDWNKDLTGTDTGNKGYPANSESYPGIYKQQVNLLTETAYAGTHAVGDKNRLGGRHLRRGAEGASGQGLRHSIIHANVPTDHAIGLAKLQKTYDAAYRSAGAFAGGLATPAGLRAKRNRGSSRSSPT